MSGDKQTIGVHESNLKYTAVDERLKIVEADRMGGGILIHFSNEIAVYYDAVTLWSVRQNDRTQNPCRGKLSPFHGIAQAVRYVKL